MSHPAREQDATGDPYQVVEHELARLLRRVRSLTRVMAQEVHPDLDPTAYGLLIRLEEVGHARLTDLAAYFGVGKPTLSRQLAYLARLGLVRGRADPADGRATRLELTETRSAGSTRCAGPAAATCGPSSSAGRRPTWPCSGELLDRLNTASSAARSGEEQPAPGNS